MERKKEESKEELLKPNKAVDILRNNLIHGKQRDQIIFEQNLRVLIVNDEFMQLMILENIIVKILGLPQ
jgi:hypothetical protein